MEGLGFFTKEFVHKMQSFIIEGIGFFPKEFVHKMQSYIIAPYFALA